MNLIKVSILHLFYFIIVKCDNDLNPEIKIRQGRLIGKYMKTRNGNKISAFMGIPYAEPPIGNLRFEPPSPSQPWVGVLNATSYGSKCPQEDFIQSSLYTGNEDCLFLNVFTSQLKESNAAVMIFIHGGGFMFGSADLYGPDYLLDEDIVLVTINYRLGMLGFLTTGDGVVAGNNGLKDQSMAIKWVYDNIEVFGGNPKRITLMGQSAGGSSVHYHMLSPLTQDLFSAAISQSGTAFNPWAFSETEFVVKNGKRVAQHFGCPTDDNFKMVKCLRSIDVKQLVELRKEMEWDVATIAIFTPVVELKKEGAFLPDHPLTMLKKGKYAQVPWLTGTTSEEGAIYVAGVYHGNWKILDQNLNREIATNLKNRNPNLRKIVHQIREFYFGNSTIDIYTLFNAINLFSDMLFVFPTHLGVNLHFQYSTQPVYHYLLSHQGKASYANAFQTSSLRYGTCHSDDLILQFPHAWLLGNTTLDDIDLHYSILLNKMWANFAKYGNPTPTTDSIICVDWKSVETKNLEYFHIGGGLHMSKNLYAERMKFWNKFSSHLEYLNNHNEL